ncbi:hypothetical protein [Vibrio genomosp. F10]|uniref:hypothetical protein n=1 Tax=Vibrio genomosp. F10 TaxID=723171 RepID=UPI000305D49E|nr:hypothetical protein [Vibrio genomosp. F10]OEE98693.1 hypothetical protein A1QK_12005 [Vibrio genomosp. F10 str. 9ZD137]
MFNAECNRGILFNHLPKLLLIASKVVESDSDLLVKMARGIKNDSNITHDHQFFRKFRTNGLDVDSVVSYFGSSFVERAQALSSGIEPAHIGAWVCVKGTIDGYRNGWQESHELAKYWSFLDAHFDLEYQFIKQNAQTNSVESLAPYLREWFLVHKFEAESPTVQSIYEYIIHMVMYWGALFELYLELDSESQEHSILSKCLPNSMPNSKGIMFYPSGELLLQNVKQGWANDRYQKSDIKWSELYRDVLKAQHDDPDLAIEIDTVDPDLQAIKKRFDLWRKGRPITLENARCFLSILRCPYAKTEHAFTLNSILFVNLFTHVQVELLNAKIAPDKIVEAFKQYPSFKMLVRKRYDQFVITGQLEA